MSEILAIVGIFTYITIGKLLKNKFSGSGMKSTFCKMFGVLASAFLHVSHFQVIMQFLQLWASIIFGNHLG